MESKVIAGAIYNSKLAAWGKGRPNRRKSPVQSTCLPQASRLVMPSTDVSTAVRLMVSRFSLSFSLGNRVAGSGEAMLEVNLPVFL